MAKPLLVEIFAESKQFTRELDKASSRTRKFGATAKIAGGLAVGALAVGLEESVKAAIHAQQSQVRLEQAFKNAHIAIGPLKGAIDDLEASGRKLGFTDEQTKNALGSLIVSTGNYNQAVKQLAIAQDLARFKSVSLEDATKALTMAHAGSLRPLKQLGIDIPKVTTAQAALKAATDQHTGTEYRQLLATAKLQDKQATFAKVLETVTGKVGGQSKAFSETAAGSMARFHAETEHLKVALGEHLLPTLTKIISALNTLAADYDKVNGWMSKIGANKSLIDIFKAIGKAVPTEPLHQTAAALQAVWRWANAVIAAIERLIGALGRIHAPNIHLPHIKIPKLAQGGVVTRPTLAMIGEAGPEAVIPLGAQRMARGMVVNLYAPNYMGDKRELLQILRSEVVKLRRRGGQF